MGRISETARKLVEYAIPFLVLAFLITYTYAKFFEHPYGFAWGAAGVVDMVFTPHTAPTLAEGDQILKIGSLTWDAYQSDLRRPFFEGIRPGETVPVVVERSGQILTIQWRLPGTNTGEMLEQLLSEWFLAYVFWGVGTIVFLFLRPKEERWWLLAAFNYLTAAWLSAGSGLSNYHIWYSALVLRAAIWLCVPVYLHLHWVFPRPLGKLPVVFPVVGYATGILLALAQWLQWLPNHAYFLGFLAALLGSLILLIAHALRQPEARRELRIIWIAILFALAPLVTISAIDFLSGPTRAYSLALLSFPALPLSYLYAAFRRQLGGLELRVNRLISIYLFLILLGAVGVPLIALLDRLLNFAEAPLLVASITGAIAAVVSILAFPSFQSFVEQHWLGIAVPERQLPQVYSGRARSSSSISDLVALIEGDILPSLLVRQFLFVQLANAHPTVLLSLGLRPGEFPTEPDLSPLDLPPVSGAWPASTDLMRRLPWVRLILPLRVGDSLLGYWLFGRRDPDDLYAQSEMPILQSLADQTAITLSNLVQTERLHAAYQGDIDRFEQERLRLSLDLHDDILNRMAALLMRVDDQALTPAFQEAYDQLVTHLREIIRGLRPALLDQGLGPALEELIDDLTDSTSGRIQFALDLQGGLCRYSPHVEQHVFRIVQEACTNAVRHAQAKTVCISGKLELQGVELQIQDDGVGFRVDPSLGADRLQVNGHFGLTGMHERAELIGAGVEIVTSPGKGTCVRIRWAAPASPVGP